MNLLFLRSQIEDYIETQAKARRALWPPSLFLRLESSQKFLYWSLAENTDQLCSKQSYNILNSELSDLPQNVDNFA